MPKSQAPADIQVQSHIQLYFYLSALQFMYVGTKAEWLTYKVLVQHLHCLAFSCSLFAWTGSSEKSFTLWEEEGLNGRPLLLIDGVWNPTVVQLLSGYFFTSYFILCQVYLKVMLFLQQSPCPQDTLGKVPLPSTCERRSLSSECSWSL